MPALDRDDRNLGKSVDIHDLERRMRQVDASHHDPCAIGTGGIFMRWTVADSPRL